MHILILHKMLSVVVYTIEYYSDFKNNGNLKQKE